MKDADKETKIMIQLGKRAPGTILQGGGGGGGGEGAGGECWLVWIISHIDLQAL